MMNIALIAAMSENRVIGINNQLPWHLPNDLKHFKKITMGKAILMGRKTYESIGKPLPGRLNVVLSRDLAFKAPGCTVVNTLEQALEMARMGGLMIIGGAELYKQLLPYANTLYLTLVHTNMEGDAHFPELDFSDWTLTEEDHHKKDEKHSYAYTFKTWIRNEKY